MTRTQSTLAAPLSKSDVSSVYGKGSRRGRAAGARQHVDRRSSRRNRRTARPLGLRQVHAAAHRRRPDHATDGRRSSTTALPVEGPVPGRGHGVPELRPVPVADGAGQRRNRPAGAKGRRRRKRRRRRWPPSTSSASTASKTPIPRNCPAACASASASPARWWSQPKILLMDEPFSALDVLTAETLRTDLLDLWVGRPHAHQDRS